MIRQLGALGLFGLVLVFASGCNKGKGSVSGKVTLRNNTPVGVGNIIFYTKDGRSASAVLNKDGTYKIGDAPVGEVKVVIQPPPMKMGPQGMNKPPEGMKGMPADMQPDVKSGLGSSDDSVKPVPIALKYQNKEETPLTHTVEKGEHDGVDFTLDP
jgi:hypothetical protein